MATISNHLLAIEKGPRDSLVKVSFRIELANWEIRYLSIGNAGITLAGITLYGDDNGLRGQDDRLFYYGVHLPSLSPGESNQARLTQTSDHLVQFRVENDILDEDNAKAIRKRTRRDEDEVYSRVNIMIRRTDRGPVFIPISDRIRSENTVKDYF